MHVYGQKLKFNFHGHCKAESVITYEWVALWIQDFIKNINVQGFIIIRDNEQITSRIRDIAPKFLWEVESHLLENEQKKMDSVLIARKKFWAIVWGILGRVVSLPEYIFCSNQPRGCLYLEAGGCLFIFVVYLHRCLLTLCNETRLQVFLIIHFSGINLFVHVLERIFLH